MENSIKEDIERLKLCSTNQCNICGRYEKEECMLERNRCEQHILSDYKRVLKENKILKEYITIAPNLNEMTATKYQNIQQEAYLQGRAEEQRKAEQIIYKNYISKQKIKEVIKELEENIYRIKKQYSNGGENCNTVYLENLAQVKILKQMLRGSEE